MKFIHTSDLHLGKHLGVDSLCLQHDMLQYILCTIEREKPDYLIIAGDVFDKKSVGTYFKGSYSFVHQLIASDDEQVIEMFSAFLEAVEKLQCKTVVAVGNHDPQNWGLRICNNFAICTEREDGMLAKDVYGHDEFGKYRIIVLPLINANSSQETEKVIEELLDNLNKKIDYSIRNILVGHLYVCKNKKYVGKSNSDFFAIDANVFNDFDYVALGHTHRQMNFSKEKKIQYSGSPIDYSELKNSKPDIRIAYDEYSNQSLNIVTLLEKGKNPIIKYEIIPNFCTTEYLECGVNYKTEAGEWRNTLEDQREDYSKFIIRKDEDK